LWGSGGGAPSCQRPMGVWGRSPLEAGGKLDARRFFNKNNAYLGLNFCLKHALTIAEKVRSE